MLRCLHNQLRNSFQFMILCKHTKYIFFHKISTAISKHRGCVFTKNIYRLRQQYVSPLLNKRLHMENSFLKELVKMKKEGLISFARSLFIYLKYLNVVGSSKKTIKAKIMINCVVFQYQKSLPKHEGSCCYFSTSLSIFGCTKGMLQGANKKFLDTTITQGNYAFNHLIRLG